MSISSAGPPRAKSIGLVTVSDDRGRFSKWIAPQLGTLEMGRVVARDLETFVSKLDANVRAGALSWKTAIHVWGLLTKLFDAHRSKDLALRVRKDNPARDVRGPDRGDDRAGAYLFPVELAALLSCEKIGQAHGATFAPLSESLAKRCQSTIHERREIMVEAPGIARLCNRAASSQRRAIPQTSMTKPWLDPQERAEVEAPGIARLCNRAASSQRARDSTNVDDQAMARSPGTSRGGGAGNRTRVRKRFALCFYVRS